MKIPFFDLRNEAEQEVYNLIDQKLRKLTRRKDGSIDSGSEEFHDNDVDALRHAYVSGVFTQEYGPAMADVLGRLNELFPLNGASDANRVQSINMDLWNNAVGRRYGQEFRTRPELFEALLNALRNGELIQDLRDKRKYTGIGVIQSKDREVIVVKENKSGKNVEFYDTKRSVLKSVDEFIGLIRQGRFKSYGLRNQNGRLIPVAKRDKSVANNLG